MITQFVIKITVFKITIFHKYIFKFIKALCLFTYLPSAVRAAKAETRGPRAETRYLHCLEGSLPSELAVVLGEHDTTLTGEGSLGELSLAVAAIFSHENYDSFTLDNDISLLELAEEVDINTYTPACMAQVPRRLKINDSFGKNIPPRARTRTLSTA